MLSAHALPFQSLPLSVEQDPRDGDLRGLVWREDETDWLKGFLNLLQGTPSQDTFGHVFRVLDPNAFEAFLLSKFAKGRA
ncbi:MAG: transposase family protein [Propionivibrio sp.]|nr:transposase family protein [Propionivibrio sp.]MBP8162207.1 transposase family protein [Propionivibrio sp.]